MDEEYICPKCNSKETYFNDHISGWVKTWSDGENSEMWDDLRITWRLSQTCHCNGCDHSWKVKPRS